MDTTFNFESTSEILDMLNYSSMSDVSNSARFGWDGGMSVVDDIFNELQIDLDLKFYKEFNPAVIGMFFDVGLLCSGVPEHWLDLQGVDQSSYFDKTPNDKKETIKIGINCSVPSTSFQSTITERGAAVIVLSHLIQLANHPVSIKQYYSTTKNEHKFFGSVILKEENQETNPNVGFWLCSPQSIYRYWYGVVEKSPIVDSFKNKDAGYGECISKYGEEDSDVFMSGMNNKNSSWTRADSLEWIKNSLKKIGIDFN